MVLFGCKHTQVKMVKAKVYTFNKQFDGFPKREDLKLIEEDLPQLSDGGKRKITVS